MTILFDQISQGMFILLFSGAFDKNQELNTVQVCALEKDI